MRRFLLTLTLALMASTVWAQQVKIAFNDGQVSVDSNGAPPRAILAEWSKVGGTNIVNGERVTGAPLTLKLVNVPEAQALEIILRSVAGYLAAPRGSTPGASHYDRILVLPTSTTQAAASPAGRPSSTGTPFSPPAGTQRFVPPRPAAMPAEEPPEIEEPADTQPAEPVFSFPQPAQPNGYRGVPVQPVQLPPMTPDAGASGSPSFGVVGAPQPGMIQQLPQQQPQQQPATPGRPTRPPGQ
jgi:hypothetical protein